jgi:hypothetical protein
MVLSSLESGEIIERKLLVPCRLGSLGITWDGFFPRLFPYCSRHHQPATELCIISDREIQI